MLLQPCRDNSTKKERIHALPNHSILNIAILDGMRRINNLAKSLCIHLALIGIKPGTEDCAMAVAL